MNLNPLIILISTAILIWLGVLTYFFFKVWSHYKNLLKGIREGNLDKILNKVLENEDLNTRQITDINKSISDLKEEELSHIQKIGFVRFNPFNEMGGDNSFALCLLNGKSDGVVITGLHTREKTRMYAKRIVNAESKHELSKEERKAIQEAMK